MHEEWRDIPSFRNYRVSTHGRIENVRTGTILKCTRNQQGILKVNLWQDKRLSTRMVAHIVADAFVEQPRKREDFISTIHLDGDKTNCHAQNLMWRPRYFTILYHRQFYTYAFRNADIPVVELKSGETYSSVQDAVITNGLLLNDVLISIHERTYVWPTFQEFRHAASDY